MQRLPGALGRERQPRGRRPRPARWVLDDASHSPPASCQENGRLTLKIARGCHTGPLKTYFYLETISGEGNWGQSRGQLTFPAWSFVFFSFKFYFQ